MIDLHLLDRFRITDESVIQHYVSIGDGTGGAFWIPSPIDQAPLYIVASAGDGWDHVSISRKNRIPNQTEMDHIYRLFFAAGEAAVQFFMPSDEHINIHPHCLHLWRPHATPLPKPPSAFV